MLTCGCFLVCIREHCKIVNSLKLQQRYEKLNLIPAIVSDFSMNFDC
uniref:Uncharacterized protein n=1 Tax=Arundo donax TaxID=35708 RepID=A0A0A9HQU7_ARUDO